MNKKLIRTIVLIIALIMVGGFLFSAIYSIMSN